MNYLDAVQIHKSTWEVSLTASNPILICHLTPLPLRSLMECEWVQAAACVLSWRLNGLQQASGPVTAPPMQKPQTTGHVGLSLLCLMSLCKINVHLIRWFEQACQFELSAGCETSVETPFFCLCWCWDFKPCFSKTGTNIWARKPVGFVNKYLIIYI